MTERSKRCERGEVLGGVGRPSVIPAFERAGRPVVSLAYLLDLHRRQKRHIIIERRLDGLAMPPHEVWAALDTIKAHEYGFVDVLVAAEGRTFTGTWFSTFSGYIQRIRGYRGKNDRDTFFSSRERWAAFQGFESPRALLPASGRRRGAASTRMWRR